ncbi:hypothetical protein Afil01_13040 [Actinorhabdospora filicis]|uniref:Uncharacterized protein n=1 Tax=Actinorhabdospora filicis TaxID=1785913 RepID=A0A9W6SIB7_9ACTN|nr:hypothetical protein [Actinorhabdospora filicis]GLZ76497.1 hypothetical protein Afil01_13040 [Actinorhabdospora filicis]
MTSPATTSEPPGQHDGRLEAVDVSETMRRTGDSERYILQAAALRRRQLRAAMLYGSSRSWRQRQALWPAALAGIILVAVIVAAVAVTGAFKRQQQINEEEQRRQNPAVVST